MNAFVCLLGIFAAIYNLPTINGFPCWNSLQCPTTSHHGYVPFPIGLASKLGNLQLSPTIAGNLQLLSALQQSTAISPLPINVAAAAAGGCGWPWATENFINNPWWKSALQNPAATIIPTAAAVAATTSDSCQNSGNYIVQEIAQPQVYVQNKPSVKILPSSCC